MQRILLNFILAFIVLVTASQSAFSQCGEQGLVINEFSNGAIGTNQEYIELLAVGCPGTTIDIRNWVIDNSIFTGGTNGRIAFRNLNVWANVPVGSIILVYNNEDKNPSIATPDDPFDNNTPDNIYVLPASHFSLYECSNSNGPLCLNYQNGGDWEDRILFDDNNDIVRVIDNAGNEFHVVSYGTAVGVAPDNINFPTNGGGDVISLNNNLDSNYRDIGNYSATTIAGNESPAQANTPENDNLIQFLLDANNQPTIVTSIDTTCTDALLIVNEFCEIEWRAQNGVLLSTNDSLTVNQEGNYSVQITDNYGCTDLEILNVEFKELNTSISNPPNICIGDSATWTTTTSDANVSYNWNVIPDGSPSGNESSETETYTFNNAGNKQVSVTITSNTDPTCTNTETNNITVDDLSDTPNVFGVTNICRGANVNLTAFVPNIGDYRWYSTDSTSTTLSNNQVFSSGPISTDTSFFVSFQAFNSDCESERFEVNVTIVQVDTAETINDTICVGDLDGTVSATANNSNAILWYDAPTGGNLLFVGEDYTPLPPPNVTTTYYAQNQVLTCPSEVRTPATLVVIPALNPPIISGPTQVCDGDSVILSSTTVPDELTTIWYARDEGLTPLPQDDNYIELLRADSIVIHNIISDTSFFAQAIDSFGCVSNLSQHNIEWNTSNFLSINSNPDPPVICQGGSLTLTGQGAVNYTWLNDGSTNQSIVVTPSKDSTFVLAGVSADGCFDTTSYSVTIGTIQPTVNAQVNDNTVCKNETVNLQANGTNVSNYKWLDDNSTNPFRNNVVIDKDTTFFVVGYRNGCSDTASVSVTLNESVQPNVFNIQDETVCANELITATIGSPFLIEDITWSAPGRTGLAKSPITTYRFDQDSSYISVTMSTPFRPNLCDFDTTVLIRVQPNPTVDAKAEPQAICGVNETTQLIAVGDFASISWRNFAPNGPEFSTQDTVTVGPNFTTTYYYRAVGNNGCVTTGNVTVNVGIPPQALNINPPLVARICEGDNVTVSAFSLGASSYEWLYDNDADNDKGQDDALTYTVNVQRDTTIFLVGYTNLGCTDTTSYDLNISRDLNASVQVLDDTVCVGDLVRLSVNNNENFFTNVDITSVNGNPNGYNNQIGIGQFRFYDFTFNQPGSITAEVSSTFNGMVCPYDTTINIHVELVDIQGSQADGNICDGDSTVLTATGGVSYEWDFIGSGITDNPRTVRPVASRNYRVFGTTAEGCQDFHDFFVTVNPVTPDPIVNDFDTCQFGTIRPVSFLDTTDFNDPNRLYYFLDENQQNPSTSLPSINTLSLLDTTIYVFVEDQVSDCNSDTIPVRIRVTPYPVGNINIDSARCVENLLSAHVTGHNSAATFNWSSPTFGSTVFNNTNDTAIFDFTQKGNAEIELELNLNGCAINLRENLIIHQNEGLIEFDPATFCQYDTIIARVVGLDPGDSIPSYTNWDASPTGIESNPPSQILADNEYELYFTSTTGQIEVLVSDSNACVDTLRAVLPAKTNETAPEDSLFEACINDPDILVLPNTPGNYEYFTEDRVSAGNLAPSITTSKALDTFIYVVTQPSSPFNCPSDTATFNIRVYQTPVGNLQMISPRCVENDFAIAVTDTLNGTNFSWDLNNIADPATANTDTALYRIPNAGPYNFSVDISLGICSVTLDSTIEIHTNTAELNIPDSACRFDTLLIDVQNLGNGDSIPSYTNWDFEYNGFFVDNPVLENDTQLIYFTNHDFDGIVSVLVSDSNACVKTVQDTIFFFDIAPELDLADTAACVGDADIVLPDTLDLVYFSRDFAIEETSPIVSTVKPINDSTIYYIYEPGGNLCPSDTSNLIVNVIDPSVTPEPDTTYYCKNETITDELEPLGGVYHWYTVHPDSSFYNAATDSVGTAGIVPSFTGQDTVNYYVQIVTGSCASTPGLEQVIFRNPPVAIPNEYIEVCQDADTVFLPAGDTLVWFDSEKRVLLEADYPGRVPFVSTETAKRDSFFVVYKDDNACFSDTSEYDVEVFSRPAEPDVQDVDACLNEAIEYINSQGPFTYIYLDKDSLNETIIAPDFNNLSAPIDTTFYVFTLDSTNTNLLCSSDTAQVIVSTGELPPGNLQFASTGICKDSSIIAFVSDTIAGTNFNWYTPLPDSTNENTAYFTPTSAGNFTVSVEISQGGCKDTLSAIQPVFENNASLNISDPTTCDGDTITVEVVNVKGTSSQTTYFDWNISHGGQLLNNPQDTNIAQAIFSGNGGRVSVSVLDSDACLANLVSDSIEFFPPVNNPDVQSVEICQGQASVDYLLTNDPNYVYLDSNKTNPVSIAPVFDENEIIDTTIYVVNTPSGAGNCNSDTVRVDIVVNPIATGNFKTINSILCSNTNVTLEIIDTLDGTTFNWLNPAPLSSSENKATFNFAEGAHNIEVEMTYGACVTTIDSTFIISSNKSEIVFNPIPVCAGDSIDVQVINLGSGDSIPSFTNWTISANGNYNAPSPKDTSLQSISFRGDFIDGIVSVEVTDSNGCFASLIDTVEFYPKESTPDVLANVTACLGSEVPDFVISPGNYEYFDQDKNKLAAKPTFPNDRTYDSTIYVIRVSTDPTICNSDTIPVQISVGELPSGVLTANAEVCAGAPFVARVDGHDVGNTTFNWFSPTPDSPPAPTQNIVGFSIEEEGDTTIFVEINRNGCVDTLQTTVTIGSNGSSLDILPNPGCEYDSILVSINVPGDPSDYGFFDWQVDGGGRFFDPNPNGPQSKYVQFVNDGGKVSVTVQDENACQVTLTDSIALNPKVNLPDVIDAEVCVGEAIPSIVALNGDYRFYNEAKDSFALTEPVFNSASSFDTTIFVIRMPSDAVNECPSDTVAVRIAVGDKPTATINFNPDPACTDTTFIAYLTDTTFSTTFRWFDPIPVAKATNDTAVFQINTQSEPEIKVELNLSGCKEVISKKVKVFENNAILTLDPTPVCRYETFLAEVRNLGSGTETPTFTNWQVTSNGEFFNTPPNPVQNQKVTFYNNNTARVFVDVSDTYGCRKTISKTVNFRPNAPEQVLPSESACVGDADIVINNPGGVYKFFDADRNPIAAAEPRYQTLADTNFVVYYTYEPGGNFCPSDTGEVNVIVYEDAQKPVEDTTLYCQFDAADVLTPNDNKHFWYTVNPNDANYNIGTDSLGNNTPTPDASRLGDTTYFVQFISENCASQFAEKTVSVKPLPKALGDSTIITCVGAPDVELYPGADSITWLNENLVLLGNNPIVTTELQKVVTFYGIVENANGCISDTSTITVEVSEAPEALPDTLLSVCQGNGVDQIVINDPELFWLDDTFSPIAANPSINNTAIDTFDFYVYKEYDFCPNDTASVKAAIAPLPTGKLNFVEDQACADTNAFVFVDDTLNGTTFRWYEPFPQEGINNDTARFVFGRGGSYFIKLAMDLNTCKDTIDTVITVNENLSELNFSADPICRYDTINVSVDNLGNGSKVPSFDNWTISNNGNFVNTPPANQDNQDITFFNSSSLGNVSVKVTDKNGCVATIDKNVGFYPNATAPVLPSESACLGEPDIEVDNPGGNLEFFDANYNSVGRTTLNISTDREIDSTIFYVYHPNAANECVSDTMSLRILVYSEAQKPVEDTVFYCQNDVTTPFNINDNQHFWYLVHPDSSKYNSGIHDLGNNTPTPSSANVDTLVYFLQFRGATCASDYAQKTAIIYGLPNALEDDSIFACVDDPTVEVLPNADTLVWLDNTERRIGTYPTVSTENAKTEKFFAIVENENGCLSDTANYIVEVLPKPTTPIDSTFILCQANGSSTFSLSEEPNIVWLNENKQAVAGNTPLVNTSKLDTFIFFGYNDNGSCSSDTNQYQVVIAPNPDGSINFSPNPACADSNLVARALFTDAETEYNWLALPATSVNGLDSAIYQFTSEGTYTVEVELTLGQCSAIIDGTIDLNENKARLVFNPDSVCRYDEFNVSVTDLGTGGRVPSYRNWTISDNGSFANTPTNEDNQDVSFNSSNSNSFVSVKVSDRNGCVATIRENIKFKTNAPAPDLGSASACVGEPDIQIPNNGNFLEFFTSDSISVGKISPVISTTNALDSTIYYVLQPNDAKLCPSDTAALRVLVYSDAQKPVEDTTLYCQFDATERFDISDDKHFWYLDNPNNSTYIQAVDSLGNATPTPSSNFVDTTYYYLQFISANCKSDYAQKTVIINPLPDPIGDSTIIVCVQDPTLEIHPNADSLIWFDSDRNRLATYPSINTTQSGIFTFYVLVENDNNCLSDTSTYTINILAKPEAPLDSTFLFCQGNGVVKFNLENSSNVIWLDNTGNVVSNNEPKINTATLKTEFFSAYVDNGSCISDTTYYTAQVTPNPEGDIFFTPDPACADSNLIAFVIDTLGGTNFNWLGLDSNAVNGNDSAIYQFDQGGDYLVELDMTLGICSKTINNFIRVNENLAELVFDPTPICRYDTFNVQVSNLGSGPVKPEFSNWTISRRGDFVRTPNNEDNQDIYFTSNQEPGVVSVEVVNSNGCRALVTDTTNFIDNAISPNLGSASACIGANDLTIDNPNNEFEFFTNDLQSIGFTKPIIEADALLDSTIFYVFLPSDTNLCPSDTNSMRVLIYDENSKPIEDTTFYCQFDNAGAFNLNDSNHYWYTVHPDSSFYTITDSIGVNAPTPSTAIVGDSLFYVQFIDNNCVSDYAAKMVSINALPDPLKDSTIIICEKSPELEILANADSLIWIDENDNQLNNPSYPVVQTDVPGIQTFYVIVRNQNNCLSDTATFTVDVQALPEQPKDTTFIVCQGPGTSSINLSDTTNLYWLDVNGNPISTIEPTVGTSKIDTFTFSAYRDNGICISDTTTYSVIVAPSPEGDIKFSPLTACTDTTFLARVTNYQNTTTFNWINLDTKFNNGRDSAYYQFLTPGTQEVSVAITLGTCTDTIKNSILVNENQSQMLFLPSEICRYDTVIATVDVVGGGTQTPDFYDWDISNNGDFIGTPNNDETEQVTFFSAAKPGIVSVTVKDQNGCIARVSDTVSFKDVAAAVDLGSYSACVGEPDLVIDNPNNEYQFFSEDTVLFAGTNPIIATDKSLDSTLYYVYKPSSNNVCPSDTSDLRVLVYQIDEKPAEDTTYYCQNDQTDFFDLRDNNHYWYLLHPNDPNYISGRDSLGNETPRPSSDVVDTLYYYVQFISSGCQSEVSTKTVIIYGLPGAPADEFDNVCQFSPEFDLYPTADSLVWLDDELERIAEDFPTVATNVAKDVNYYYMVQNQYGCLSDTVLVQTTVNPKPEQPGDTLYIFCQTNDLVQIDYQTGNTQLNWLDENNNDPGRPFINLNILDTNDFRIYNLNEFSCSSDTSLLQVQVREQLNGSLNLSSTFVCPDEILEANIEGYNIPNPTVQWSLKGKVSSIKIDTAYYAFDTPGTERIDVIVEPDASCSDTLFAEIDVLQNANPPSYGDTAVCLGSSFEPLPSGSEYSYFDENRNPIATPSFDANTVYDTVFYMLYAPSGFPCPADTLELTYSVYDDNTKPKEDTTYYCQFDSPERLETQPNLVWYLNNPNNAAYDAATDSLGRLSPLVITNKADTLSFYNQFFTDDCISDIGLQTVIIKAAPEAIGDSSMMVCVGSPDIVLHENDASLNWMDKFYNELANNPTVETDFARTEEFYVTVSNGECLSDTSKYSITVRANLEVPSLEDTTVCVGIPFEPLPNNPDYKYFDENHNLLNTPPVFNTNQPLDTNFLVVNHPNNELCPSDTLYLQYQVLDNATAPNNADILYCKDEDAIPVETQQGYLWYLNHPDSATYDALTDSLGKTAPTPSTASIDTILYYNQFKGDVCLSEIGEQRVIVKAVPNALGDSTFTICINDDDLDILPTADSLAWYDEDGDPIAGFPTVITDVAKVETYYVEVVRDNCPSPQSVFTITVRENVPEPEITDTTICVGGSFATLPSGNGFKYFDIFRNPTSTNPPTFGSTMAYDTTFLVVNAPLNELCPSDTISVLYQVLDQGAKPVEDTVYYCLREETDSLQTQANYIWYLNHPDSLAYNASTDSLGSTPPLPSSATPDTIAYFNQFIGGSCASDYAQQTVIIRDLPPAIGDSIFTVCIADANYELLPERTDVYWLDQDSVEITGSPLIVTNTPKVETYYAIVNNGFCNSDTSLFEVTVRENLELADLSDTTICVGENFDPLPTNAGYKYFTMNGTEINPAPTFNTSNVLDTSFKVVNHPGGEVCPSDTIIVRYQAVDNTTVPSLDTAYFCEGEPNPVLESQTTYIWYTTHPDTTGYNASTDSLGKNIPTVNVTVADTFNYFVQVDGAGCITQIGTQTIVVNRTPQAIADSSFILCINDDDEVILPNADSLVWFDQYKDEITGSPTVVTDVSKQEVYYNVVKVNGCSSDTAIFNIQVDPNEPLPAITDTNICVGETFDPLPSNQGYFYFDINGNEYPSIPTFDATTVYDTTFKVVSLPAGKVCPSDTLEVTFSVLDNNSKPTEETLYYCMDNVASPMPTEANLIWYHEDPNGASYNVATDSIGLTPPTPSTQAIDTIRYFVQFSGASCLSQVAQRTVIVRAIPPALGDSLILACVDDLDIELLPTADSLAWYDVDMSPLPSYPTITTENAKNDTFFVEVVREACPSELSQFVVKVQDNPVNPDPIADSLCWNSDLSLTLNNLNSIDYYEFASNNNHSLFNDSTLSIDSTYTGDYLIFTFDTVKGCYSDTILGSIDVVYVEDNNLQDTTLCSGDTVSYLNRFGIYNSVSWTTPENINLDTAYRTSHITKVDSGLHYFVTTQNGCSHLDSINIAVLDTPSVMFDWSATICELIPEAVVVSNTGDSPDLDITYNFFDGNDRIKTAAVTDTLDILVHTDSILVTQIDNGACKSDVNIVINPIELPKPQVDVPQNLFAICLDSVDVPYTLTGEGDIDYTIIKSDGTLIDSTLTSGNYSNRFFETGTYFITNLVDENCPSDTSVFFDLEPVIPIDPILDLSDSVLCDIGTLGFAIVNTDASVTYRYKLDDGPENNYNGPVDIDVTVPKLYEVTVIAERNGCIKPYVFPNAFDVKAKVEANFVVSSPIREGAQSADFYNRSLNYDSLIWTNTFGDSLINSEIFNSNFDINEDPVVTCLTAFNSPFCPDTICIEFERDIADAIFMPNSFTPNGNGLNEMFGPEVKGDVTRYSFIIFDRWGQVVFESKTPGEKWDGRINDQEAKSDLYQWRLNYYTKDKFEVQKIGFVNLLR